MYGRPRVNLKRGSTFTFTCDLQYISFTRKIYVRTQVKITQH